METRRYTGPVDIELAALDFDKRLNELSNDWFGPDPANDWAGRKFGERLIEATEHYCDSLGEGHSEADAKAFADSEFWVSLHQVLEAECGMMINKFLGDLRQRARESQQPTQVCTGRPES